MTVAILGGILYGAWAYVANYTHHETRWISAWSQAAYTFSMTYFNAWIMEFLFVLTRNLKYRFLIVAYATFIYMIPIAFLTHYRAGTENLMLTVLPVFAGSFIYKTSYTLFLWYSSGTLRAQTVPAQTFRD